MIRASDRYGDDVEHKSKSKVALLIGALHARVRHRRRRGEDARRMGRRWRRFDSGANRHYPAAVRGPRSAGLPALRRAADRAAGGNFRLPEHDRRGRVRQVRDQSNSGARRGPLQQEVKPISPSGTSIA